MSSRDTILKRVRANQPAPLELPPHLTHGVTFADPRAQFLMVLEMVGGRGVVVEDVAAVERYLRELPVVQDANVIVSLIDGIVGNREINDCPEPHELADVDVAICAGEFGVAENGAIWVTDNNLKHRAIYFICQHLVLLVKASEIVSNMHLAYERLGSAFVNRGFSGFISGPSKTADIEQSLVIGAQGPRSLKVVLVERW